MSKRKSKSWSNADLEIVHKFIDEAKAQNQILWEGVTKAAEHFGVSPQAVYLRYLKSKKGIHTSRMNRKTTKVPLVRKKAERKKREEIATSVSTDNVVSFDIKDMKLDLKNKKLIIVY